MTTDTLISRIQLRRGNLEDLPILKEGELGYAMDKKRLFIGNPSQTIIADDSPYYNLNFKIARPSQIVVVVDNTVKTAGVHYNIVGTRLTFNAPAPDVGSTIEVGVNNEIVVDKADVPTDILPIIATVTDHFTGIYFDVTLYNTAVVDYSLKDTAGNMQVGQIRIISNGTNVSVADTSNSIGTTTVTFSGEVNYNNVRLLYTNSSLHAGTFYYTIKAWYTQ